MKKGLKFIVVLTLFCGASYYAHAQEVLPEEEGVPIDGGASLLLAAGAAYGIKKIAARKKM